MFLNRLTPSEKKSFLMLSHHVAHVDGDFSDEELDMIRKYCMEMQMDEVSYDATTFNLTEILSVFESDKSKKIALLEIMALIYADGRVAKEEEELLSEMIDRFELNPNLAIVYREWSKTILSLFVQGEALIHL